MNNLQRSAGRLAPPRPKPFGTGSAAGARTGSPDALYRVLVRGAGALIYSFLYNFVYEVYLFPQFEYLGFRNYADSIWTVVLGFVAVVLAAMVLPGRIRRASDFCSWAIFILIYVPSVIAVAKSGTLPGYGSELLVVSLFISQCLISTIPRMVQFRTVILPQVSAIATPVFISSICLLISAVLVVRFASVMTFASFDEIYIQREISSTGAGSFPYGYLILWQTFAISPLLIAAGLYSKNKKYFIPPLIALVVIYMITAAKMTVFIYATIMFLYVLIRWGALRRPTMLMLMAIGPLALASLLFLLMGSELKGGLMIATGIIIMRGLGIQGMLTNSYAEFFVSNPHTFYSHLNIVSVFVDYPFSTPLGTEMSYHLLGSDTMFANASFWATDGIAAAGNVGVIFIGVVIGFLFVAMNSLTRRADIVFVTLALMPFVMALVNVSIFTTLLSGGGILMLLFTAPLYDQLVRKDRQ